MSNHILVVDDDPGIQQTLAAILDQEGYPVSIARDGLDAIEKIQNNAPIMIILDLMMPKMNGYEFLAELKRQGPCSNIPIVVLTADNHAAEKALLAGATVCLEKPFDYDQLVECILQYTNPDQ